MAEFEDETARIEAESNELIDGSLSWLKMIQDQSSASLTLTRNNEEDVDELLVQEVQLKRVLWDTFCRGYKDNNKKNVAWKEISVKLHREVDELKRRWKDLRDGMNRCLKKMKESQKSGAGAAKTPTCKLFQQLLFIRDTLQNREATSSNLSISNNSSQDVGITSSSNPNYRQEAMRESFFSTNNQDEGAATSNLFISNTQEFEPLSPPPTPSILPDRSRKTSTPAPPPTTKKRKSSTSSEMDILLMKALSESGPKPETPKESSDWLFCKSLVEILEKLPAKKNRLARLDIQKILLSYEFDED